jgi:Flp pilus assembly protein TadG
MFFLLMPTLFGAFGLSVDVAVGTYTGTSLQSALDTATQSAVSASNNPAVGSTPGLTASEAQATIYRVYDANRNSSGKVPFLACQGTDLDYYAGGTPVNPVSGCGFTETTFTFTPSGGSGQNLVEITVVEYSHYIFLHMFNMEFQPYEITSSARLTASRG